MNDIIAWAIIGIVLGWLFWRRGRAASSIAKPVVSVEARIVKMRGNIGPIKLGSSSGFKTIPGRYITFEILSGERSGAKKTFFIEDHKIGFVAPDDSGTLTLQGVRFIGFERKA
ncbi:MAG: DUF2500 domain-containing protein [Clostridiales bacterium]|jgi:hypothetical protein|nr:DUF2500 domain-containing protein [Clostridiales bacterium]